MDSARAAALYVSDRPVDHPVGNFQRDQTAKAVTDSTSEARARGVVDYRKISYHSSVGDLEHPGLPWW